MTGAARPADRPADSVGRGTIPMPPGRRSLLAWCVLLALIAVEFVLFRRFLHREVLWAFPPDSDQVAYLLNTYQGYERLHAGGLAAMFRGMPAQPQGAMMEWQGALLCGLLGPSRFSALLLNFIYFALLQVAIVWTARRVTGRWAVGFLALGLLLCARLPFDGAGGIADFRIDFIAFCLHGIFLCAVIWSGTFESRTRSLAAGAAGAYLVCFRFITGAYLALAFAMALIAFGSVWVFSRDVRRNGRARRRVGGMLLASLVIAAVAAPVLWVRRQAIHDYYVVGHVTGPEKTVRALAQGTVGLGRTLAFYPDSLGSHLGVLFGCVAAGLLILALVGRARIRFDCAHRRRPSRGVRPRLGSADFDELSRVGASPSHVATDRGPIPTRAALGFSAACVIAPLVLLTLDVSKSPVVGGIMVGPVVWLVILGAIAIARLPESTGREAPDRLTIILSVLAAVVLILGLRSQARNYSTERFMTHRRADVEAVNAIADRIDALSIAHGRLHPIVFTDTTADPLDGYVMRVLAYERHGHMLDLGVAVSSIFDMPDHDVFDCIAGSDFAIITSSRWPLSANDYPFNRQLARMHGPVVAYCERTMHVVGHYRVFQWDVTLYERN